MVTALKQVAIPVLLCFAAAALYTLLLYYPLPRYDHWHLVTLLQASDAQTLAAEDLFELHGCHWHASGYGVMLVSAQLTGLSHWAEVTASLGFAALGYLGLVRLLAHQSVNLSSANHFPGLLILAAFFLFSIDQTENWLWGWQVAVFASVCGAIWCLERLTRPVVTPLRVVIAALCGAMAIYGFATGWPLIPIGFAILFGRRAHRTWRGALGLLIWTLFSALILWHFFLAQAASGTCLKAGTGAEPVSRLDLDLLVYAMNYVASPVARFSSEIAVPVFLIASAVGVWALRILSRRQNGLIMKLIPGLALCAYAFGAGLITGLGRSAAYGTETAFLGRYITFGNLFWIGILSLVLPAWDDAGNVSRKYLTAFVALILVMKIATIGNVTQKAVPRALEIRAAAANIANCYPDISTEAMLYFEAPIQEVDDRLEFLSAQRLSAFKHRTACPAQPAD